MEEEITYLKRKKISEIIDLLESEIGGTSGWSGEIKGWTFNIRKIKEESASKS